MQTRMQKYYEDNDSNPPLRQRKNESLYENINNYEDIDYKLDSNATLLDSNAQEIDVERIKKILDTKYNKEPKRKSIQIEEDENEEKINLDETREYDINAILEKARSEKEVDYEKDRLKKIRDTQFDILNSLDIKDEKEEEESKAKEDTELMDLINTITMRESNSNKEMDPLDILTDLKGSDDTVVIGGVKEEESVNETSPIMSLEEATLAKKEADEVKEQEEKRLKEEEEESQDLSNTLSFTQSDFDDFNDLKKEVKSSRALIYVVIVLVSLILIAGVVIFLNSFLNIGLF